MNSTSSSYTITPPSPKDDKPDPVLVDSSNKGLGSNVKETPIVTSIKSQNAKEPVQLDKKEEKAKKASRHSQDIELVKRTLSGDKEAFRELFDHYQAKAFSIAFGILRSKDDAEEVVQEAFVKAYLALKSYKGDSSFYTWFYRIVANMAIDFRRKLQRRGQVVEYSELVLNTSEEIASNQVGETVMASSITPFQELSTRQELMAVNKALMGLSEEHRAVVTLREIEGLSYDEIAKITGVTQGTVMSRLFYARKYLMDKLKLVNGESL